MFYSGHLGAAETITPLMCHCLFFFMSSSYGATLLFICSHVSDHLMKVSPIPKGILNRKKLTTLNFCWDGQIWHISYFFITNIFIMCVPLQLMTTTIAIFICRAFLKPLYTRQQLQNKQIIIKLFLIELKANKKNIKNHLQFQPPQGPSINIR